MQINNSNNDDDLKDMSIKFRQPFFLADIFKKIRNFAVKGFSLVELLIVVAIVAILAVMFIPNIFSAKVSARDSARTSDLNQFKAGLKMYSMINRGYPTTTDWISIEADVDANGPFSQALNNPNFLSAIPRDPSYAAGGEYSYKYIATTTDKYTLCAKTEGREGYVCIDQDNNSVAAQVAYVPGLGGTPPVQIIPTIALTGAAIASPYTESDANTRFPSGLQFDVTNAVSATVNGGAPVSLAGGTLTAVSNADAKTADSHSYYVVVTSSDGHTAGMTISYAVGSVFACGSVQGAGGLTYGTVLGPDGKCWLDRNLGATQVAASASDANAYGYYYQWGRPTDGHQVSNSGTTSANAASDIPGHANFITEADSPYDWRVPQSPNQATLWAGANGGSNNPCPTGWHVPTQPEWATVAGYFSPQTSVGAFNSSLKLPLAGHRRRGDAALSNRGSTGSYWSSSPSGTEASNLAFNSGVVTPAGIGNRAYGFSVRCVKDDDAAAPIIPTIALTGAAIASPYTESDANTRFPSGLQFDVTNAVSATVNGGAPVSLAGGVLTAVSNADAKTAASHSYYVVVTSSDGHTAEMTISYTVGSVFACGSSTVQGAGGLTYGTVVGPDGKCWLDRNLGATQVATSASDANAYGYYYQWGRLTDGHQVSNSGVTSTNSGSDIPGHANFITEDTSPYDWRVPQSPNEATLWAGVSGGSNNPCPTDWHVPTQSEWGTLAGYFSPQTSVGAFNSTLKLPLAGTRNRNSAALLHRGIFGYYWSSSPSGSNASSPYFGSGGVFPAFADGRAAGFSVRCVKDDTVAPTIALSGAAIASPYTTYYANLRFPSGLQFDVTNAVSATVNGGAPVSLAGGVLTAVSNADAKTLGDHSYHVVVTSSDSHTAEMTITYHVDANSPFACGSTVDFTYKGNSVSYGTVEHNGECWMDRNLGASQVATAYNDSSAYGDLFQWGRLDDGHQTRTSGVTTTLSNTDSPGHSNFIIGPYDSDWRSPRNDNLWQGASAVNSPCPSGWRVPTEAEWVIEKNSWVNGAFASPLKLAASGGRNYGGGYISGTGENGWYWSSTAWVKNARYLAYFGSNSGSIYVDFRNNGYSVRCIKE